jgi:outer membrane protein assembly factor BamB
LAKTIAPLYGASNPELFYWAGRWRPYGLTLDGTLGYDYNVTIPKNLPGAVIKVTNQTILGGNTLQYGQDFTLKGTVDYWAISTKKDQEGTLLWTSSRPIEGNQSYNVRDVSEEDGVFVEASKEARQFYGYSLATGKIIWGPTDPLPVLDWVGIAQIAWVDCIAYGKLYTGSYGGVMHCFDIKTGKLIWNTTVPDPYSETMMGHNWCLGILRIAAGKVYIGYFEHSYYNPKVRGAPVLCMDAETGQILWEINMCTTYRDSLGILGDGVFVLQDLYDGLDYAIAKGPSATTVTAPDAAIPLGTSLTIKGTVTDVSPGTKDSILPMRFPNGVPAVSDECMSDWMQYVYMQFPRPTNATGVEVTIDVLDSNGNYRNIGTTTSDSSGAYGFSWQPDIPGTYKVIATFAGSKSYWPSHAVTYFTVDEAPQASPPPTPTPASAADLYFIPATAGMIVAIVVVGALIILLMLRKR